MKRRNSGLILAVVVVSLIAQVVYFVSVTTESWLLAEVEDKRGVKFQVSYGLNKGRIWNLEEKIGTNKILTLYCLLDMNVCAWTCLSGSSENHISELADLYDSGKFPQPCFEGKQKGNSSNTLWRMRQAFIPASLWLAALILLLTSGLVSLIAFSLTLYNVNHIPENYWVSIASLYVWFPASSALSVLGLAVWVLMFHLKLKKNLGMADTIVGYLNSTDKVELGYSMWCQLGVISLQASCISLLRFRESLFDRRLLSSHPAKNFPPQIPVIQF